MIDITPLIVSIIGGLSGLAALLKVLSDSRNARPTIAEAYENMATKQAEQITDLRKRVTDLENEVRTWREYASDLLHGVKVLSTQLVEHDIAPCWEPTEPKEVK